MSTNEWNVEAHRGRCRAIVMTPERARAACVPCDDEAVLVVEVRPDEGASRWVSFGSLAAAHTFLRDLRPRLIDIETTPDDPRCKRPVKVLWGTP